MREIASSLATVPSSAAALYPIEQPCSGRASSTNTTATKPNVYAASGAISTTPRTGYTGRYTSPDPVGFDGGDLNLYRYAGGNPLSNIDLLGLNFTNNSSKPVCIIKDNAWSTVAPGVTIVGDVDAVAAPKGQVWGTPPSTSRVYKWIDCFHASISDVPGKSPFVGIGLTKKSDAEIDALPFRRKCLCKAFPGMSQSMKGGPTSDFGDPPASCP